jgi:hypothetical protein
VIHRKFVRGIFLATILAAVAVACKQITPIKLDPLAGQFIKAHEPDNARCFEFESDGSQNVVFRLPATHAFQRSFEPTVEGVGLEIAFLLNVNHLGIAFVKHSQGASYGNHLDGHVKPVQDQNVGLQGNI